MKGAMTLDNTNGTNLELNGLSKRFHNRLIFNDLNLQINRGEFVAIVGRSGCGKSTLLRMIAGLEPPSGGAIFQDGIPLSGINPEARIMFQEPRLLPWKTVYENVLFGAKEGSNQKERATHALQQVGLGDFRNEWPRILSGGQRQRVALARALVSRPRLLLLDEPLGALDALTRIEMQQLIETLWIEQKFTALLVTHDVEEAVALGDRVILLQDGKAQFDFPISLPRPRQRGHHSFTSLAGNILDLVMNPYPTPLKKLP